MLELEKGLFWEADGSGGSGAENGEGEDREGGDGATEENALNYKSWFSEQPKEIQTLITDEHSGLHNALSSEREARKNAEKELRRVAGELEEGSKAREELEQTADTLAELETRAEFYEEAHAAGIVDLKLAYLVAREENLIDRKGRVDFDVMKENHPTLFTVKKSPPGNAGEGAGGDVSGRVRDMNAAIRQAAGRG